MGMKSKGYALVLCASLLCIGSAWGEGGCPDMANDFANIPVSAAGEHNKLNTYTIVKNDKVGAPAREFSFQNQENGQCMYKTQDEKILILQM